MATRVTTLVMGMFLTGCANSLLTKYQDMQCVEGCAPGERRVDFEQPVWQTLNMFIGEFLCGLPLLYSWATAPAKVAPPPQASVFTRILARMPLGTGPTTAPDAYARVGQDEDGDEDELDEGTSENALVGWRICLMWFPAVFDICGTTLMNVGLILTPVSIYQMSRGALVLWVGILSVIFLRRRLFAYQWLSLIIVTAGVCLVGLSGSLVKKSAGGVEQDLGLVERFVHIAKRADDDPAKVALGVALILFAQNFTACQFVVEEKIMARYKVEPLAAVTLEGFFGLLTTLVAMPFLHIFLRDQSPYFDMTRGWTQIISHPAILWISAAICISIGSFNYFGLSVTSSVSATSRSTIDTCRTLGIWVVSLGLGWEKLVWPFSLLQFVGFSMLVYGTFVFNGLLSPVICKPSRGLHLPHEPELEEAGELPASAGQGRAGYDVLPTSEETSRS